MHGLFSQLGRDWGLQEFPRQGGRCSLHPPLTPEACGETVSPETRALLCPRPPCPRLYRLDAVSAQKQSISVYRSYILRACYTHSSSFLLDFLELCEYRVVSSANKDGFPVRSSSSIVFLPSACCAAWHLWFKAESRWRGEHPLLVPNPGLSLVTVSFTVILLYMPFYWVQGAAFYFESAEVFLYTMRSKSLE